MHYRPSLFIGLLAMLLLPGGIRAASPQKETAAQKDEDTPPSSSIVQREVMDFADRYASAIRHAIDAYVRVEPDPAKRTAAQEWKTIYTASAMGIAAAPDPNLNLLDMAVFISAGKWAVNTYWVPKVFGKNASTLRDVYASMDREIWQELARVLTPEQQQSLRRLISKWESSHPESWEVSDIRLRNLDGVHISEFDDSNTAKGILANLRRVLGKVNNSLLYGERMMFYMEHTPLILRQQTDLTLAQIAQAFPLASLNIDGDRLTAIAENLPQQIQAGIDRNQSLARELLPELQSTLASADHLTGNLNTTLTQLSAFAKDANGAPLRPEDYTALLRQADSTLQQLNTLVLNLNTTLAPDPATGKSVKAEELARLLDARADHATEIIFHHVYILLAAIFAGVALILILAKILFGRRKV